MKKLVIPVVGLAVVVLGLFLSGVLGEKETTTSGRSTETPTGVEDSAPESHDFSPAQGTESTGTPASNSSSEPSEPTPEPEKVRGVGALAGRVIDATGAPVAGVIVHLVKESSPNRWVPVQPPALDDQAHRTETDSDGKFSYSELAREPLYALFIRSDGWVGKRKRRLAADGSTHEIVLAPGDTVSGLVLDPRGGRVAGALVQSGPAMSKLGEGVFIAAGGRNEPDALHPEAVTREDGTYTLSGIPFGEFSVSAAHPTWGPSESVNLMQGQNDLTIELRPATAVAGRVFDGEGTPIAGATVRAVSLFAFGSGAGDLGQATTDATGGFEIDALPAGRIQIRAEAEGFPSRSSGRSIVLVEGETVDDVEIILERGAAIVGVVKSPSGTPVVGARIKFRQGELNAMSFERGSGAKTMTSDETGSFRLEGLRPDQEDANRRIQVDHAEYAPWEGEPVALLPGAEVDIGEIVLAEALTLRGLVADLAGVPVVGAQVKLREGAPGEAPTQGDMMRGMMITTDGDSEQVIMSHSDGIQSATTDEEGRYVLRIESAGRFHITARGKGYQEGISEAVEIATASVSDWNLSLTPALQISGFVLDELGVPCEGVEISARRKGTPERTGTSGVDGAFQVDGLDEGEANISVKSQGWRLAGELAAIPAGTEGITVTVERPGAVTGRLIDAESGRPITQFSLTTRALQSSRSPSGEFSFNGSFGLASFGGIEYRDPDGRFLLENLSAGDHEIRASAPNMVDAKIEVTVASARTTEVTIELERAGVLVGRVTDHAGNPLPGVSVSAARLKEDGTEAPPEREPMGFGGMSRIEIIGPPDEGESDAGGGAMMVFSSHGPGGGPGAQTDEDGRYRIEGLEGGGLQSELPRRRLPQYIGLPGDGSAGARGRGGNRSPRARG